MSFPRRPTARVTFLSGKVTKAIGAGHDGLANIRLARLPIASCAKRAGANSHVPVLGHRALLPLGAAMLGVMRRRRRAHFDTAIRGLRSAGCGRLGILTEAAA